MTRLKHVLILTILILPMFVFAPSLVAGPKEVLTNRTPVESALPAQFAEETLRVAVYAEDNTTLPSYASGGVSTAHHANLIQFLESNGYAVTALSTQDILDHQLVTASFDTFVLPNNLPKDEIVNLVMDFWLGGGGILSFDNGLGFMYYQGMIVEGDTGNFALLYVDPMAHWGYEVLDTITVDARHPAAKDYHVTDIIPIGENTTVHDVQTFAGANGDDFVPLFINTVDPLDDSVGFALDNTARKGGKIVQLPGNCSVIPAWESSVIVDSIDWLAPRPKGRILVDLNHDNWIPVDPWDPMHEFYPLATWRNGMVNHSYTVDKSFSELTIDSLVPYDMLVTAMPDGNFTNAEVEVIRTWVMNGGGLFIIADLPGLADGIDSLIAPFDISLNKTAGDTGWDATCVPTPDLHPLHENALYLEYGRGAFLNVTGDAYPLWYYDGNIVAAGQEYGEGRVIMSSDGNMAADNLEVLSQDNYQYCLNVANWLTATQARVLVYADTASNPLSPNIVALNSPVAQALNDLGIEFYMTSQIFYFNMSLFWDNWDMVIFDNNNFGTTSYQPHLIDFVEGGGKIVLSTWALDVATGAYFGVEVSDWIFDPPVVHLWESGHPIFNLPAHYDAPTIETTLDLGFGTDALIFTTFANATPLAGYTASPAGAAIVLGAGGNVIVNGPLLVSYNNDTDDSTYPDNLEIWENEIAYLYFDRPTIDHPADVTYMETETGNEIIWHPTADAGPWEYVFSVNGTPVEGGRWTGAPLAFSIDGVNVSITEYELTVFDRLGYGVSDLVVLNVTEYIAPPGPGGLDPTLLIIIGAAVAGVVIILVVVMKRKKK